MDFSYFIPPILGAFIGYFTNWLALKMLFRPFEEKRIFGIRVPFTPGLIPKRRKEIAEAIAKTVEEHILPLEKMKKLFEESNYKERVHKRIELIIDEFVEMTVDDVRKTIKEGISIGKFNVKGTIIVTMIDKVLDKSINKMKEKVKRDIKTKASKLIEEHLEEELPILLSQLNIRDMVIDTFMELDIETLEEIVIGFSANQLRYITYTGAVLGFFIGAIESIYILISH